MDRGQSEVLGVVMLLGLVLVSGAAVVAVGYTAIGTVQDQSEHEQEINEVRAVSQDITDTIHADGSSTTDVETGYDVTEGAEVTISVDGPDVDSYNTGRLVRDDLVYEGGLVVDGNGQVVTRPEYDLGTDATMLQFPTVDYDAAARFHGEIRHDRTDTPDIDPDQYATITIESQYYEQWYDQLEDANAIVTKDDSNELVRLEYDLRDEGPRPITNALMVGMADGSSFDLNEIPDTDLESYDDSGFDRDNAVLATTVDDGNMGGGSAELTIQGEMRSEGDIDDLENHTQTNITRGVESHVDLQSPTPTEELLISPAEAANISDSEVYEADDGDLEGGIYYTEGDLTLADDVDVTEQTILVVDGDMILEDATVEAAEAIDVHVHGSLRLEDEATVETTAPHTASQVTAFVDEDVFIDGETDNNDPTGPEFTGLIHGTDATVDHVGNFTVYGALTVDAYEISDDAQNTNPNHNAFTLYYDERLEGTSPYATSSVQGSVLTEFFEDVSGDVHDGDYEDEGNIDDELLVTGAATLTNSLVEGDLYVEDEATLERTNVQAGAELFVRDDLEVRDGVLENDVWVDGDVTIEDGSNFQDDLYVNGDVEIESGTYNDIYVAGELTINGTPNVNGEVHVVGDLIADGEPVEGPVYVDGGANLSGQFHQDLHVSGDVRCSDNVSIDGELIAGGDVTGDCDDAEAGGTPHSPQVPDTLFVGPELIDHPTYQETTHNFDLRFAHVDVE